MEEELEKYYSGQTGGWENHSREEEIPSSNSLPFDLNSNAPGKKSLTTTSPSGLSWCHNKRESIK